MSAHNVKVKRSVVCYRKQLDTGATTFKEWGHLQVQLKVTMVRKSRPKKKDMCVL